MRWPWKYIVGGAMLIASGVYKENSLFTGQADILGGCVDIVGLLLIGFGIFLYWRRGRAKPS